MNIPDKEIVEADCSVLLLRALMFKTVKAFGEDGDGKYGKSQYPIEFLIDDMDVTVYDDLSSGEVKIFLKGYDAKDIGHIATDKNFVIGVNQHLEENYIDPACLEYSPISMQGRHFVSFLFDIPKLFG